MGFVFSIVLSSTGLFVYFSNLLWLRLRRYFLV